MKRFKRNRSGYLTQFQKGTSRDASKHGRNAGTAVFVQKGSTLKAMEEFNIQGKQTSFYKYCPGTFGYTLVQVCRTVLSPTLEGNKLQRPNLQHCTKIYGVQTTGIYFCCLYVSEQLTPSGLRLQRLNLKSNVVVILQQLKTTV